MAINKFDSVDSAGGLVWPKQKKKTRFGASLINTRVAPDTISGIRPFFHIRPRPDRSAGYEAGFGFLTMLI